MYYIYYGYILMDILIVTHTHLGGHPADGGYIISCFDEVGGVLLQLKLTQPLVDGLRVLTTERREIYEAALSHTHRNIHLGTHTFLPAHLALQKLLWPYEAFLRSAVDLPTGTT